jgi:hypothetical protein
MGVFHAEKILSENPVRARYFLWAVELVFVGMEKGLRFLPAPHPLPTQSFYFFLDFVPEHFHLARLKRNGELGFFAAEG